MEYLKQLSIFIENKEGRIYNTLHILEDLKVNIRGLSMADTAEFGILRLIVADPVKVKEQLEERDYIAKLTEVIPVLIEDQPGGLNKILKILDDNNLNLEYLYAVALKNSDDAIVLLRLEEMDKGYKVLKENNAPIVDPEKIYSI